MKSLVFVSAFILSAISSSWAQQDTVKREVSAKQKKFGGTNKVVSDSAVTDTSDITWWRELEAIEIHALSLKTKKDQKKYNKLLGIVKKVYPYAKAAEEKFAYYETETVGESRRTKKEIMEQVEKELWDEYGDKLKKLTFNQGRVFLKLIDRQTGYTSYEVIKDWRGKFTAWGYNIIAGIADIDLKAEFDPENVVEDMFIDDIMRKIDNGEIALN